MSATTFSSLGACGGYLAFVVGLLAPILRRTSTEHTDSTNPFFMGLDWLAHLDDAHLVLITYPFPHNFPNSNFPPLYHPTPPQPHHLTGSPGTPLHHSTNSNAFSWLFCSP